MEIEKTRHIGDVGTRVVVSGVVERLVPMATEWGNGTGIQIRSADGTLARWQSSHGEYAYELKVGQTITIRATVKRYRELDGTLWVILTNGRIEHDALALA